MMKVVIELKKTVLVPVSQFMPSPLKERTFHLAMVDAFQMLGFVLAQGLQVGLVNLVFRVSWHTQLTWVNFFQAAFVPIGEGPIAEGSTVVFNMYTATGSVGLLLIFYKLFWIKNMVLQMGERNQWSCLHSLFPSWNFHRAPKSGDGRIRHG